MQRTDILKLAEYAKKNAMIMKSMASIVQLNPESSKEINEQIGLADEAIQYFTEYFPVTSVHRSDITSHGFPEATPTDDEMERLASKLSDHFTEYGGYWETIETFAEDDLGLTITLDTEDEEDNY